MTEQQFIDTVLKNPANAAILARLPGLGLPDAWLVASCLVQTIWNAITGRPVDHGIKDYDLFYFDASDLSWDAEDQVIRRVGAAFSDIDATIEVKNQARVHLWYEDRFGRPHRPLTSSGDGIDGFLELTSQVGITRLPDDRYEVYAPHGLELIFAMIARPNSGAPHFSRQRYLERTARWRQVWPELTVID